MRKRYSKVFKSILLVGMTVLVAIGLGLSVTSFAKSQDNSNATVRIGKNVKPVGPVKPGTNPQKPQPEPAPQPKPQNMANETPAPAAKQGTKIPPTVAVSGQQQGKLPQTGQMLQWGTMVAGAILLFIAFLIVLNRHFIKKLESKNSK